MTLSKSPTRRGFLHLAGAAALAPHTLLAQDEKRHKPPPPPPAPPLAPFADVEYQGAPPALLQNLPTYTDAEVNALLRESVPADPLGLPGAISADVAAFARAQLLALVPRVLVTNARGAQPRRIPNVFLSPYGADAVLASAFVTQFRRSGATDAPENRLVCLVREASKVRLTYTTAPSTTATLTRDEGACTLVPYDPASSDAALQNPDGGVTLRLRTSLAGGAYVWANNLTGTYRADATTAIARGLRQPLRGTPWCAQGYTSVFLLLQQLLRVALWDGGVRDPFNPRYYDVLSVLCAREGGYRDNGLPLQLLAFGVDWQNGEPTFIPGHLRVDLTLTYAQEGPSAGALGTLTLAVHDDSDFQGSGGVSAVPLFSPSHGEWIYITDARLQTALYNDPRIEGDFQRTATADMVALTKGVYNTANSAWGTIPYLGT
jgi:hypothetical protein